MSVDHYTYRVTWSPADGEHVGLCVEFPSLSWLAKTPEAALKGIRQVVAESVADIRANGEDVPSTWLKKITVENSGCASQLKCTGLWPGSFGSHLLRPLVPDGAVIHMETAEGVLALLPQHPEAKLLLLADQSSGSGDLYARQVTPAGGWGKPHPHMGSNIPFSVGKHGQNG